jgi:hypothetical protein
MIARTNRPVRAALVAFGLLGLILLTGCYGGPRRVPASGTIEIDGQVVEGGIVYFNPNSAKGNTARVSCLSPIQNGKFKVSTTGMHDYESGSGVPLGWYKVSLRVNTAGEKPRFPGPAAVEVNPIYLDPDKTPLEVEVVDNPAPGAYDLKITSQP